MIRDMLKKQNVRIVDHVNSWQEAVYAATDNLVEQGFVTGNYPRAIIEMTERYGAYYVLAPNVALIHARPEDGVIKKQLAVTMLLQPIYFKNKEFPAKLLITLAAENSKDHIESLQQIGELLMDEKRLERVLNIKDEDVLFEEFVR